MAVPQKYEERLMTGEELARHSDLNPCELVNGRVVPMAPAGHIHGAAESRLDVKLALYAEKMGSGRVMVGEVGIYTRRNPDTVRGADIVFMSNERYARCGPSAFLDVAPELVVEILSPEDRPGQVKEKIQEYLAVGVDRVWFVDPRRRSVLVYRFSNQVETLGIGDILCDEEILPGFSLPLSELFRD
ncbi:MAG: Uma2 family endonuclease [Thermoanaerobaculia bacterium]